MKTSIHVAWISGCIYVAAMVHDAKGAENPCPGEKTVTVTRQQDGCTHKVTVELFFSGEDDAVNHPGSQSGVTPNWFYYWSQTPAKWTQGSADEFDWSSPGHQFDQ